MGQDATMAATQEITFDPANMIALTRKICDILEEEIALLKRMKLTQIQKFYDDKIAITSILETYKEIIVQNPEVLESIPDRTRKQLREEAARFELLAAEDGKQMLRAKEVHRLVMEAVKRAVEQKVAQSTGYNKRGVVYAGENNAYVTPSVSVNENF